MEYEVVIGLEVHVQLNTRSKAFCADSAVYGGEANSAVGVFTLALPGTLPVLNKNVVDDAVRLGLALNCQIRQKNTFARKQYFYPDLPKGYQITQFSDPICEKGELEISISDQKKKIGITRIHIEEDAGKNIHDVKHGYSLLDFNRAGVPLLEIVSEPDLRSPQEAAAYLRVLRQMVRFLGISDGNMEEGSLRCDANISLRPKGTTALGARVELKNINSFRFVEHALQYEKERQEKLLIAGDKVVQETRLFDSTKGITVTMRSKEDSEDYRYMPEPDLPPVYITNEEIEALKAGQPKLPQAYFIQLTEDYGLSAYDAETLCAEKEYLNYFEEALSYCHQAKLLCNWMTTELFGALKKASLTISNSPLSPKSLAEIVTALTDNVINGKIAKNVFEESFKTGRSPKTVIEEMGVKLISDEAVIKQLLEKVIEQHPQQWQTFKAGKDTLKGFFVGQVMRLSQGQADPVVLNKILDEQA